MGKVNGQPLTGRMFVATGVQLVKVAELSTTTLLDAEPFSEIRNVPFETARRLELNVNHGTTHLAA